MHCSWHNLPSSCADGDNNWYLAVKYFWEPLDAKKSAQRMHFGYPLLAQRAQCLSVVVASSFGRGLTQPQTDSVRIPQLWHWLSLQVLQTGGECED